MAITTLTLYILISSSIVTLAVFTFVGFLIYRSSKKRTEGILYLIAFYFCIGLGELFLILGMWHDVYISNVNIISGVLETGYTLFYGIGYIVLYIFLNRHILQDNEIVRSLIVIALTLIFGIVSTLIFSEIYYEIENPIFYQTVNMTGPDIPLYLPTLGIAITLFAPVFLIIHVRMIWMLIKMTRIVEDKVEKFGFVVIFGAIVCLILSIISASLFTIPSIYNYPILPTLLHTLRFLFIYFGLWLGYFGWVFPEWLQKKVERFTKEK